MEIIFGELVHPNKLCDDGDNGHGLDNSTPWHDGYYEVDLTSDIESLIKTAAGASGFSLVRKPLLRRPTIHMAGLEMAARLVRWIYSCAGQTMERRWKL